MKIEVTDEEREKIVKEVARMMYSYMQEHITVRAIISQEIKHYFDEEKRIKAEEDRLKDDKNENDKENDKRK